MDKANALSAFKEKSLQKLLAPAALVILYLFFGFFGRNFFSYSVLINILDSSYYIGFLAIGVTFVIITGGIDLSVGTVMMCAAIVGGTAYKTWGWPMWAALVTIMCVATLFGLFNGLLISRLKLPPFIGTLGTMMISMGLGSIISNVRSATFPTRESPDGWFKSIFKIITPEDATVPTGALVLLTVTVIAFVILTRTKMGRYTFAIGSNKEAARLSGVNVKKWEMMAYLVSGICAGFGGIAFAAVYTTVMPAQGQGFELYAIAGAVIGGVSLSGGIGSVWGTLIGVYIMSTLRAGLPSMDLQSHYQTFFTGIVVIGAVLLDIYRNDKASQVQLVSRSDKHRKAQDERIAELRRQAAADPAKAEGLKKEAAALKKATAAEVRKIRKDEKKERRELLKEELKSEKETRRRVSAGKR